MHHIRDKVDWFVCVVIAIFSIFFSKVFFSTIPNSCEMCNGFPFFNKIGCPKVGHNFNCLFNAQLTYKQYAVPYTTIVVFRCFTSFTKNHNGKTVWVSMRDKATSFVSGCIIEQKNLVRFCFYSNSHNTIPVYKTTDC